MDLSCNHAWVRVEENEQAGFGYRILFPPLTTLRANRSLGPNALKSVLD